MQHNTRTQSRGQQNQEQQLNANANATNGNAGMAKNNTVTTRSGALARADFPADAGGHNQEN